MSHLIALRWLVATKVSLPYFATLWAATRPKLSPKICRASSRLAAVTTMGETVLLMSAMSSAMSWVGGTVSSTTSHEEVFSMML